jgi:glycosyltransferase involved in cell wall biosynthesis
VRIAIFGVKNSFGLARVGGTDSFFRRLSRRWVDAGHPVTFVNYGYAHAESSMGWHQIHEQQCVSYSEAAAWLRDYADVILVNALRKADRFRFLLFRWKYRHAKKFLAVYSLYKEHPVGRHLHFVDAILFPYRSGAVCMSPRLTATLQRWRNVASTVLPPVGPEFYCPPERKPLGHRLRVLYVGRTERGKGIKTVVEILERLAGDPGLELAMLGYFFPGDAEAAHASEWLAKQAWLNYQYQDIQVWSPAVDQRLARRLHETDILLLPYDRLSSSIDTPLLLLEGMAASCCIITKPLGDIPSVYGPSPLLIKDSDFVSRAVELIRSAPAWLASERSRVYRQACAIGFDEETVARRVLDLIKRG